MKRKQTVLVFDELLSGEEMQVGEQAILTDCCYLKSKAEKMKSKVKVLGFYEYKKEGHLTQSVG